MLRYILTKGGSRPQAVGKLTGYAARTFVLHLSGQSVFPETIGVIRCFVAAIILSVWAPVILPSRCVLHLTTPRISCLLGRQGLVTRLGLIYAGAMAVRWVVGVDTRFHRLKGFVGNLVLAVAPRVFPCNSNARTCPCRQEASIFIELQ